MPPKKKPKTEKGFESVPDDELEGLKASGKKGRSKAGNKRSLDTGDDMASEKPSKKKVASSEDVDGVESSDRGLSQDNGQSSKNGSKAPPAVKKAPSNSNITDVGMLDFSSSATTKTGSPWTLKFSSWNVNGVRAWLKNNGMSYVQKELPDIFCLQETKCDESDLPHSELTLDGYKSYWSSADKKGYSGTGLYSKTEPLNVTYGIGVDDHDKEGRVITAEFEKFYFVTAYVPNAGEKLKRVDYRVDEWDPAFRKYLKTLDDEKPVILCGDLNVAHHEIDLANPKSNLKTAGFSKQERESFTTLLEENDLMDSFRHLYPDKKEAYSYWSYRSGARKNNKGWRLDYFLVSKRIIIDVCDHVIRSDVLGSDHCPIVLFVAL